MELEILSYIAQSTVIASFIGGLVTLIVVKPLRTSIDRLCDITEKQDAKIEDMNSRVIRLEESTKGAHKRLDGLDEIINHGRWEK